MSQQIDFNSLVTGDHIKVRDGNGVKVARFVRIYSDTKVEVRKFDSRYKRWKKRMQRVLKQNVVSVPATAIKGLPDPPAELDKSAQFICPHCAGVMIHASALQPPSRRLSFVCLSCECTVPDSTENLLPYYQDSE